MNIHLTAHEIVYCSIVGSVVNWCLCARDVLILSPFCKPYFVWWQSSDIMVKTVTLYDFQVPGVFDLLNIHRF